MKIDSSITNKKTINFFNNKLKKLIEDAHGDTYTYNNVVYRNMKKDKVAITCKEHGDFMQVMDSHVIGRGCPKCGKRNMAKTQSKGTERFIEESINVHGDKYDYSFVNYKRNNKKVRILCKKKHHGLFLQRPNSHLNGGGCPVCSEIQKIQGIVDGEKEFIVYYVETTNKLFKIGVTSQSIKRRFHAKEQCNIKRTIFMSEKMTLERAVTIEQRIVKRFKKFSTLRKIESRLEYFDIDIFKGTTKLLKKLCTMS